VTTLNHDYENSSIRLQIKHVSVASLCAAVLAAFSVVTNGQPLQTGDQFTQQQQLTAADGAALDQVWRCRRDQR
jgi:hypothetical protein